MTPSFMPPTSLTRHWNGCISTGKPVRELFAGLYEQVQLDVAKRAKILGFRKRGLDAKRHTTLINLASKVTN